MGAGEGHVQGGDRVGLSGLRMWIYAGGGRCPGVCRQPRAPLAILSGGGCHLGEGPQDWRFAPSSVMSFHTPKW